MAATVRRPFTFGGRAFKPGDPYEPTGVHQEKALWSREYLSEGYTAPPPSYEEWGISAWTDGYDPHPIQAGGPEPEASRPHNRKRKVTHASN